MLTQTKDPIQLERTAIGPEAVTASDVLQQLAVFDVSDISEQIAPYLAAAAAEVAFVAGVPWRYSADDPIVAMLRLFSRVGLKSPDATGPHTQRLFDELRSN